MINLNSITKRGKNSDLYVLPGGKITDRVYYALDVLMEMRDLAERINAAREARKAVMKTKGGAVLTRKKSGNNRYFLGI